MLVNQGTGFGQGAKTTKRSSLTAVLCAPSPLVPAIFPPLPKGERGRGEGESYLWLKKRG